MTDTLRPTSHIMAVDDEPSNLKLVHKLLTSAGYAAPELVQDPRTLLEAYARRKPDLILLDLNMPHLDGFAVLQQLADLRDPLPPPVLVLTAQTERQYLLRALELGARDCVTKPIDRTEILMRVRNLLDAHLAHRLVHDQKSVLEAMVRVRTAELQRTRLQVVQRLGRAAEYRDNETGLHTVRMSHYAAVVARSLGWSEDASELLLHASPMHDIGKIGIPDAILLKQDRLTPEEWAVMQTHVQIGAAILDDGDSPLLQLAAEIALHHHEKWNGSGYPFGLQGRAIPQSARIVAVVDVFDALSSERPYKAAWPLEDALRELQNAAGSHFDPEVVAHFMRCLPEILEIRAQHQEPAPAAGAPAGPAG